MNSTKLCLGTAQFGIPYGITNTKGRVSEREVKEILNIAAENGIQYLDTAQAYGDAESIIGRNWPRETEKKVISKLPSDSRSEAWQKKLETSMKNLKTEKLNGYLLHSAEDLKGKHGKELIQWLKELRAKGLVERIGISIYEESELEGLPLEELQIVQLPVSVYDQRMIYNGVISKLAGMGIAVHARSVLMQGLLLKQPEEWPKNLSQKFREHHMKWVEVISQNKQTKLEAAIEFVKNLKGIEAVLVGVLSKKDIEQIITAWNKANRSNPKLMKQWIWQNKQDIDPRRWPKK